MELYNIKFVGKDMNVPTKNAVQIVTKPFKNKDAAREWAKGMQKKHTNIEDFEIEYVMTIVGQIPLDNSKEN